MKKFAFILLIGLSNASFGQDSLGMEGDNLDLNGVLELFKDSKSIEDFETKLNKEDNEVNNLDLNNDGTVDYIMVIDYQDSTSHALTLRVPVTSTESQDVAVIEIEEIDGETVNVQIVGDEDLYGTDYYVEPTTDDETNAANVYSWTPIRHIYGPKYVVWVSPWRFGLYPTWYKPWKRVAWHVYHPRMHRYHAHYRVVHYRRGHRAHLHYRKHRVHSAVYHNHRHGHHNPNNKTVTKKRSVAPAPQKSESNRKRPGGTVNKNPKKH